MEDLTRAERIIQRFMDSDKLWDLGMTVLSLVVMIVVGLLILKVILKITRKALDKSRLDEVLYSFIVNRYQSRRYHRPHNHVSGYPGCADEHHHHGDRCRGSSHRIGSQGQLSQHCRRYHDNNHSAIQPG